MRQLTLDKASDIQEEILDQLKSKEAQLSMIRDSKEPIGVRWQALIGVVIPIQIETIAKHGFSPDQQGLSDFNKQLMKFNLDHKVLRKLNEKKWDYLIDKAFGLSQFRSVPLEKIQKVIVQIANEMTSEDFLQKVDQIKKTFSPKMPLINKRKLLLAIIFPVHLKILADHGFDGDLGYIEAQRAILDHYYDPVIIESAIKAQETVFKRAELK